MRRIGSSTSGPPARRAHVGDHPLVDVDHVVGLDERQLDVELREVGLAVGTLVLVPEAADDLVVALEPGDHQELLEELRRLRQRVERPGLAPRRDQEVARALGRRAREHRRLDLEEALPVQELAHRAHHRGARRDRLLHRLAAQVQIAVAQAHLLADLAGEALDLERRGLGVGERAVPRRPAARTRRSPARGSRCRASGGRRCPRPRSRPRPAACARARTRRPPRPGGRRAGRARSGRAGR